MIDPLPEMKRPAMEDAAPAPGRFVRMVAPEYAGTGVYHGLYLPIDWAPGNTYPVIVEYPGNQWTDICTGRVEDCRLGFGLSGGRGVIWVVMPFVDQREKTNALTWWGGAGGEEATARYCRDNLQRLCAAFGGDPHRVILAGFSRGAIACGYIGLRDDQTAALWAGFLADAHFDGVQFTVPGAPDRLARIRRRPLLILFGQQDADGKANSLLAAQMLQRLGEQPTVVEIADAAHTDLWVEHDCPARRASREWLRGILDS